MKTNLIKLNERRVENDEFVMKSCIINLDKVISVHSGKLTKGPGAHIIGTQREIELRMIRLEGNHAVFVDESVEEIFALIQGANVTAASA